MNTIFIDFKFDEKISGLPKQTEVALYRIVSELINNTLKHASASKININLQKEGEQIIINYFDNGIGFNVKKMFSSSSKGLGLSNIISRAKSINGTCSFNSEPGKNFRAIIRLTLNHKMNITRSKLNHD